MPYKNREDARKAARARYLRNKDVHLAKAREWRERNRDAHNAYLRRRHAANKERENAYQRKYYAENKSKKNAQSRARYQKDKEKHLARSREQYKLDKARGIRRGKKYPQPTRKAPAVCECCGRKPKKSLHLDHCHAKFVFRGWLCGTCNTGLGMFGDSVERLRCAIRYLEKVSADE